MPDNVRSPISGDSQSLTFSSNNITLQGAPGHDLSLNPLLGNSGQTIFNFGSVRTIGFFGNTNPIGAAAFCKFTVDSGATTKVLIDAAGNVAADTATNANHASTADVLTALSPASSDPGQDGEIRADATYLYVYSSAFTGWGRVSLISLLAFGY